MPDALRLALGTLSILRVPPPRRVDSRTAGQAMLLAPGVGALLGALAAVGGCTIWALGGSTLLAGLVVVAALAWLTRGIHLDGLADTADGLGSGRDATRALSVMKRSDIGPFGVVALVLALGVQAVALAGVTTSGVRLLGRFEIDGGWALAAGTMIAVVAGRVALPLATRVGLPPARIDGLGASVAETVPRGALVSVGLGLGLSVIVGSPAPALGLIAAELLLRRCRDRFGGVTGDVLGAAVETATTVTLLALALPRLVPWTG